MDIEKEYSQGICDDGAAILCDGQPLTIEEILQGLRERDEELAKLAAMENQEPEFDKKLFDSECRASVSEALGFQRGGDYAWSYLLAQIKEVVKAAKLTAPARIGSTIFGVGVDTSAVIERAQREYEYRAALKADPAEQVPDAIQLLQRVAASTTDSDELIRLRSDLESCEKLLKLSGRVNSKLMDELFAFKKPRYKRADDLVIGDTILHEGDEVFIESIENFGGYVRINESETLSPPEAQMKMVYPYQNTHDSERADQE